MDIFLILFNLKVCCVFSLESPHRGDSNEYTQYTIFNIKKKITQNYPKSAGMGFCSKGLKNEFETTVVNEPSVFEPLKFYCSCKPVTVNIIRINTIKANGYTLDEAVLLFLPSQRATSSRKVFATLGVNSFLEERTLLEDLRPEETET